MANSIFLGLQPAGGVFPPSTFEIDGLGVTTDAALTLLNQTTAALGAQQVSPSLNWRSYGFKTGTSESQPMSWRAFSLPVQGASNPTALLKFQHNINDSAWVDKFSLDTAGGGILTKDDIGAGTTSGMTLQNTTAAAAGVQQASPSLELDGNGWKTDTTAGSQAVSFRMNVLPVQGAAAPTATLQILSSINGGSYTQRFSLTSAGVLACTNNFSANGDIQAATSSAFYWASKSIMTSPVNGNIRLTNNGQSDFGLLIFGLATAAFPALKRSGTGLQVRLGDDTNYGAMTASGYNAGASAGVSVGPFTTITSITVVGGIVTDLQGS